MGFPIVWRFLCNIYIMGMAFLYTRSCYADEFGLFIGDSMRLEPVIVRGKTSVKDLLTYYMGKNTEDRQKFIIENLRIEEDEVLETIAYK